MNAWVWLMRLFHRPPPAHEGLSPAEKARREAELRYWSERADAVERLANLRGHEKG